MRLAFLLLLVCWLPSLWAQPLGLTCSTFSFAWERSRSSPRHLDESSRRDLSQLLHNIASVDISSKPVLSLVEGTGRDDAPFRRNDIVHLHNGDTAISDTLPAPNPKRLRWGLGLAGGAVSASYTYLGLAWYADQNLSGFRWFNDFHEWRQMDKAGHAFGAYHQSRAIMEILKWGGAKRKQVLGWGGAAGFLLQLPIEVFDGFAPKWGASWGDLVFNAAGAGLATLNEGLWQEPRLHLKFSFWPSGLADDYPDQLGSGTTQILKDYNGQTYWLSLRVNSFLPEGRFKDLYPDWLNLCVGYGAEGLIGGYGRDPQSAIDARESRQYYLGLDIDLEQIKTRKKGLKLLFGLLNVIRLPLPALELHKNKVYFRPFAF